MITDPDSRDFDLLQDPAFLSRPKLRVLSDLEIWLISGAVGVGVFLLTLAIQWIIYDRVLHQDGLRFVGSAIAALLAMALAQYMKTTSRNDRITEIRRLEAIAVLNHHIRNSLQTIAVCSSDEKATAAIRQSIDRIERVLNDVMPSMREGQKSSAAGSSR